MYLLLRKKLLSLNIAHKRNNHIVERQEARKLDQSLLKQDKQEIVNLKSYSDTSTSEFSANMMVNYSLY